MLRHIGSQLRTPTAGIGVLVDDHQLTGFLDRLQHRIVIERDQRAWIDDLAADALLLQDLSRLHGLIPHQHIGHDGHILALAADRRLTKGNRVVLIRHFAHGAQLSGFLALSAVQQLVLKDQYRVIIADRLLHQALGIICRGRADYFQAGAVDEIALQRLGVLCAAVGRAAGCTHDHGYMHRTAGHIAHLGSLIYQLIHHAEQEVAILQIGYRAHAVHGGAYTDAGDQDLGDGRIDAADLADILPLQLKAFFLRHTDVGAELVSNPLRYGKRTAHTAGDIFILAQHEYAGISAHFLSNGAFISVCDRHHRHSFQPSQNTLCSADSFSGNGAVFAYSTASSISASTFSSSTFSSASVITPSARIRSRNILTGSCS